MDRPPPLLELHRTADGGLFDRLLENLETIAGNAEGPLTTPDQLDRYRTNADDEINDDGNEPPEPSPGPATMDETSQRRWPRQPN